MGTRVFCTLFLFIVQWQAMYSQNYTLSYRILGKEEGLLGRRAKSFVEDDAGFVWMQTHLGIARFDGHQFKWFTETNSDLRGIAADQGTSLKKDDQGNLWSLFAGEVDVINPKTFDIQPLEEIIELPFNDDISSLFQTPGNYLVLQLFKSKKWYSYHSTQGFTELDIQFLKRRNYYFQGDHLLLQDKEKLIICNYKTGKKVKELPLGFGNKIRQVKNYNVDEGLYWTVDAPRTFNIYSISDTAIKKVFQYEATDTIKRTDILKNLTVMYLPQSKLLVTNLNAQENGLSVIDIENQRLIPVENSKEDILIGSKLKWCNSDDVLWINSKKNIVLLQIKKTYFQQYYTEKSLRGLRVFNDHLFMGRIKMSLDDPQQIDIRERKGTIWGLEQNIKDELWVGGQDGIFQIDIQNNTITQRIPSKYTNTTLWTILKSQEEKWWAGSFTRGLFHSPAGDSLHTYDQYNEFESLYKKSVNHLQEDEQYIWVCSNIGLYLVDKTRGVVKVYNSSAPDAYRLPINQVNFLHKDTDDRYWLATSTEGLIRFTINEEFEITDYKRYSTKEGLSSDVLYAIIEDGNNRLWISTFNGISCLDKNTERIQAFYKEDGIYELEFNRNSYTKTADGRIFFGSQSGATAFYPDDVIKTEEYNFPIYITQFSTYNKNDNVLTDQTQKVLQAQKINLQPSDRFFRLNVAMLDLFNSNQLRYAYKIEGLFDDFQLINNNTLEIGGLPYGKYTLRIRGQGADKRFSTQELSIPLIVMSPFYWRWWFITLCMVVALITIYQIYLWRIHLLSQRQKELELLVKERTAKIEKQALQLKEINELKSKFFTNISHELRTPLTLLLSPMDSILKEQELSDRSFTYFQMMRQNGQKLLKRINELLDLSRLGAKRLEVNASPTFLYPFLKTVLSTFESAAHSKNIQLLFTYELDEKLQIELDDDKVEKVVSNYLSNALKFTPRNGTIKLRVTKRANHLHLSISDTGPGILPGDLSKIFDRFYQARKEDQLQGAGIGLSLCKELAKLLNGRVWATSEMGNGSIFYLELPFVETFAIQKQMEEDFIQPTTTQIEIEHKDTVQQSQSSILIVEDNPDLRTYLTMMLENKYQVMTSENGQEALDQLMVSEQLAYSNQHKLPSLIISDIMMPVMDGIQLLTTIKSSEKLQRIPMIMLTARQSPEVKLEALRIGVDDYLTKPFREEELKARVFNLINNSLNRQTDSFSKPDQENEHPNLSTVDLEWLKNLEQIIIQNLEVHNLKMADVAAQMALSPRRLQQKLKSITGLTPKQYQLNIRLSKARDLLKSGKVATVKEVMFQYGFENYNRFTKIYQQAYGIKPIDELK